MLREDRDALQRRVEELEARIALQEREYFRSPDRNGLNSVFYAQNRSSSSFNLNLGTFSSAN
jgi:hypothetical protein